MAENDSPGLGLYLGVIVDQGSDLDGFFLENQLSSCPRQVPRWHWAVRQLTHQRVADAIRAETTTGPRVPQPPWPSSTILRSRERDSQCQLDLEKPPESPVADARRAHGEFSPIAEVTPAREK
jgi:hypothetical protein